MILTFKRRCYPARAQHAVLASICEQQRVLYNAALSVRVAAYDATRHRERPKSVSLYEQLRELTDLRREDQEFAAVSRRIQAGTLKRLDRAYKAFFRRVKTGGAPGFPIFKGRDYWNSFGFDAFRQKDGGKSTDGGSWDGKRLRFHGLPGGLRIRRALPAGARVLNLHFVREGRVWHACFQCEVPYVEPRKNSGVVVGVDCGVRNTVTLSTGKAVPCPKYLARGLLELKDAQRAVSAEKRGSRKRRKAREKLARLHRKVRNRRRNFLHKQAKILATHYGAVAIEKLSVRALAEKTSATEPAGKRENINRHLADASPAMLREMLRYKTVRHGARLYEIDPPKDTARECYACGVASPCPPDAEDHTCPHCGVVEKRALNSARVVLIRAHARLRDGRVPAGGDACELRGESHGPRGEDPALSSRARGRDGPWRRIRAVLHDDGWA